MQAFNAASVDGELERAGARADSKLATSELGAEFTSNSSNSCVFYTGTTPNGLSLASQVHQSLASPRSPPRDMIALFDERK